MQTSIDARRQAIVDRLKKARDTVLCEDVAAILAAARRPISASVLTEAIRRQHDVKIRAKKIEESLEDIASFLEREQREEVECWRPYDASFGHWLEEFYERDLCEAHRALALAFSSMVLFRLTISVSFPGPSFSPVFESVRGSSRTELSRLRPFSPQRLFACLMRNSL